MGLVRLRVEILQWNEGHVPKQACPPKDDSIMSWLEPCQAETSIRNLMHKISTRFEEIHVGKGKLGMKWLRDGYGDILASTLTVGDCFTDRSDRSKGPVDPKDWTVQVDRMKPAHHELQNPLRFVSLAPESSARASSRLISSTLQQAVAGRHSLQYVRSDQNSSYLARRRESSGEGAQIDPDHPIRSRERDVPSPTQQTQTRTQRVNSPLVVADSQPSPEQNGTSYGTPQSLSLLSPKDGLPANISTPIDISDSPVRNSGFHIQDDPSPKSEVPEAETLINQIPTSNAERVTNPPVQTPIGIDGFRKPALPQRGKNGLTHSPNVSTQAPRSRHATLKRPNPSLGRLSLLDPVETDIESSQELPPLKRTKLTTPRQNSLVELRSFGSINREAQDTTMRDDASPEVTEEPLRSWPSRNGHDSEPQPTILQEDLTKSGRPERRTSQSRHSLSKISRERSIESLSSRNITILKSSISKPNDEGESVQIDSIQYELIPQEGLETASKPQSYHAESRAIDGEPEDEVEVRDTFDIPSSSSPELPTSAQMSRKSRLQASEPKPGSITPLEGADVKWLIGRQALGEIRGRKPGGTLSKDGSLKPQSVSTVPSPSVQKRQEATDLGNGLQTAMHGMETKSAIRAPNDELYKSLAQNTQEGSKSKVGARLKANLLNKGSSRNVEKTRTNRGERGETAKEMESELANERQAIALVSRSPESSRDNVFVKTVPPSSTATSQKRLRLGNTTPAKKADETPGHVSSILRSSTSHDRRSGTSVSFADAQEEPTSIVEPTPTRKSASFIPVNLSQKEKLDGAPTLNSTISDRIKSGFKGALKGNELSAEKRNGTKTLEAKGKGRAQEREERLSPVPKVAKTAVSQTSKDQGDWEPYTVDGVQGPSRNPDLAQSPSPVTSRQSGLSQPKTMTLPKAAKRAQSVSPGKTDSNGGSSGSSSPRSPAREVASSASSKSAEASVEDGSDSGSEDEESDSEDSESSEEDVSAGEEAQPPVHSPPTTESMPQNEPLRIEHSPDKVVEANKPKTNGYHHKAEQAPSSEDSNSRADEDEEADLQLQSENRRSLELGSSQKKAEFVQNRVEQPKEPPRSSAPQPKTGQASQTKASTLPKRSTIARPLASADLPRSSNGRFVGVSTLNAKSKKNASSSQKPFSNATRHGQPKAGLPVAKAIQIDSADDSDDSSSEDSEVEIKADSQSRQSRNKALEGLIAVTNLYGNGKRTTLR